jgi:hypothetical protein
MEEFTKIECARIQLKTAIKLFQQKNYISSITLAGAANDVFSSIAEKKTGIDLYKSIKSMYEVLSLITKTNKQSIKEIKHDIKASYNELKHNDKGGDYTIQYNFKFEAREFIVGALINYELILWGDSSNKMVDKFNQHF